MNALAHAGLFRNDHAFGPGNDVGEVVVKLGEIDALIAPNDVNRTIRIEEDRKIVE
jgi:hypothetical protein